MAWPSQRKAPRNVASSQTTLGDAFPAKPKNKFGACPVEHDGHVFPSAWEGRRYLELRLLESQGIIRDLQLQVTYELQPAFRDAWKRHYASIKYTPDFVYVECATEQTVAEDAKGVLTDAFGIRRRLFQQKFPQIRLDVVKADKSTKKSRSNRGMAR